MSCLSNLPVNVTCAADVGACRTVVNATVSTCKCFAGRMGDSCDELEMGLTWVYALDFVLFSGLYLLTGAYCYYMWTRRNWREEFAAARLRGVTSSHPNLYGNKTMLVWRFVWLCVFFGIQVDQLVRYPNAMRAFTVWNFVLIMVVLGLGTALSLVKEIKGESGITESAYWRINANMHWILLEAELPNALIVTFVYWIFLFCGAPCATYSSIIQHAINVVIILAEWLMCSHTINIWHLPSPVCWIATYAFFHTVYMLVLDPITGHAPIYFFLDNSTPAKLGWVVGILALVNVVYGAFWAISAYALKRGEGSSQGGTQLAVSTGDEKTQKVEDLEA